jgi:hypothetical protein
MRIYEYVITFLQKKNVPSRLFDYSLSRHKFACYSSGGPPVDPSVKALQKQPTITTVTEPVTETKVPKKKRTEVKEHKPRPAARKLPSSSESDHSADSSSDSSSSDHENE